MKHKITEEIPIPEGITCSYSGGILHCKSTVAELARRIKIDGVSLQSKENTLTFTTPRGNRTTRNLIMTNIAHIRNMFAGLQKKFVYTLETCNVHFPMTAKVEGQNLIITNFLGEKTPRRAQILPNVDVSVKGQTITLSSIDREAAGQTAANMEKATKIRARDRRIFQDGIFIVEKPRRED